MENLQEFNANTVKGYISINGKIEPFDYACIVEDKPEMRLYISKGNFNFADREKVDDLVFEDNFESFLVFTGTYATKFSEGRYHFDQLPGEKSGRINSVSYNNNIRVKDGKVVSSDSVFTQEDTKDKKNAELRITFDNNGYGVRFLCNTTIGEIKVVFANFFDVYHVYHFPDQL